MLERYCRRAEKACAGSDERLRRYLKRAARSPLPPLIHIEKGRDGAGFGAVMQVRGAVQGWDEECGAWVHV